MDGVILGPPLTPATPAKSVTDLILDRMNHFQQKTAQVDGQTGTAISFEELLKLSEKLAHALRCRQPAADASQADVSGHRTFVIFCENRTEALVAILAALKSRCPAFLLAWTDSEQDDLQVDLGTLCAGERPDLVVCSSACVAAVLAAAPRMPWLKEVLVAAPGGELLQRTPATGAGPRVRSLEEFLASVEAEGVDGEDHVHDDGDTAFVIPPVHGADVQACTFLTFGHIGFAVRQMLAGDYSGGFGWTEDDVVLAATPVCTAMGVGLAIGLLALGATQVLVTGSSARRLQIALHTQGVTQLLVAPAPARALARRATIASFIPEHLRGVLVAGDVSRADRAALLAWLPVVDVRTALLDMDTCCTQLLVPVVSPAWSDCRDAAGAPAPGVRAYIADVHSGCCLPAFCVGELLLKRDEDVDWTRTGSLAYYDHARLFHLVNRLKSVVKATFRHPSHDED